MKKTLLTLSLLIAGALTAYAGYYNNGTVCTMQYPNYNCNQGYSSGYASYTIGCTTYYYNTSTRAIVGTQNICNTTYTTNNDYLYQYYTYPVTYTQPTYTYTYPSYQYQTTYPYYGTSYPSQYYTYGYSDGTWYPGYSSGGIFNGMFDNNYTYNSGCYWQNGYQVCY